MKSARGLIAELEQSGVLVWADGYHIRYKSARPLLERHRTALVRQKPAILDLLSRPETDHSRLLALRAALDADEDRCVSCGAVLGDARLYQCEACADQYRAQPGHQEPYWGSDERLRIPSTSPPQFRWWQGGQSPLATAIELGGTPEQLKPYADTPSRPGVIRKEGSP